ncbi:MAG: helix-turn-helix domain-containing protein [Leptolyngbyaceae cyanobacterium SL_5_14]|nr:helix-turn-helix domain-containing protein [Leptolyngbyaceae cyanobacterium SL_5_14]
MAAEALITYEGWDLTQPTSPLRSRLYSLPPIGIGTSEIESLTGYVARLADAHCVSPGDLIAYECKALVRQPQGKSYLHQISGSTEVLNGTGQMANEFIQILHNLTLRQDLRHLTFLHWGNVLPAKGLMRRFHAWCPVCYQEWQENGQKIYELLLWTLSVVTFCPKHCRKLLFQCPHCDRQIPLLAWHSRPGYCPKCQRWLGSTLETNCSVMDVQELEWQTWATRNVGELIAQSFSLTELPSRAKVARALSICIAQTTEGNITEFACRLGLLKSAVSQWRSGKALPQLSVLLKICRALDVSIIDFLHSESLDHAKLLISSSSSRSKTRQPRRELEIVHYSTVSTICP